MNREQRRKSNAKSEIESLGKIADTLKELPIMKAEQTLRFCEISERFGLLIEKYTDFVNTFSADLYSISHDIFDLYAELAGVKLDIE